MAKYKYVLNAQDMLSDIREKNLISLLKNYKDQIKNMQDANPAPADLVEQMRLLNELDQSNDNAEEQVKRARNEQVDQMNKLITDFETFVRQLESLSRNEDIDISQLQIQATMVYNNLNKIAEMPMFDVDTKSLYATMQVTLSAIKQFKSPLPAAAKGRLEVPNNNSTNTITIDNTFNEASKKSNGYNYTYIPIHEDIFHDGNLPSRKDFMQGQIGDCFLHTTLMSVAHNDPDFIQKSIKDNGDTVTVRFFGYTDAEMKKIEPVYVTVPKLVLAANVPRGKDNIVLKEMPELIIGSRGANWTKMFELAYAYSGLGVTIGNKGKGIIKTQAEINAFTKKKPVEDVLESMAGGTLKDASLQLLGKKQDFFTSPISDENEVGKVLKNLLADDTIVISGQTDVNIANKHKVLDNHMFQIVSVDEQNQKVHMRNPHGLDSEENGNEFDMSFKDFTECFGSNIECKKLSIPEDLEQIDCNKVKEGYKDIVKKLSESLNKQDTWLHRLIFNSKEFNDLKDSLATLSESLNSNNANTLTIQEQMADLTKKTQKYVEHTKQNPLNRDRREKRMIITSAISKLCGHMKNLNMAPENVKNSFARDVKIIASNQIAKGFKKKYNKDFAAKKFYESNPLFNNLYPGRELMDGVFGKTSSELAKEAARVIRIEAPKIKQEQLKNAAENNIVINEPEIVVQNNVQEVKHPVNNNNNKYVINTLKNVQNNIADIQADIYQFEEFKRNDSNNNLNNDFDTHILHLKEKAIVDKIKKYVKQDLDASVGKKNLQKKEAQKKEAQKKVAVDICNYLNGIFEKLDISVPLTKEERASLIVAEAFYDRKIQNNNAEKAKYGEKLRKTAQNVKGYNLLDDLSPDLKNKLNNLEDPNYLGPENNLQDKNKGFGLGPF